jgi:hypothetical protein
LLLEWGGSNLDEIRINGLDNINCEQAFVTFANDYDGFVYKYDQTGAVFSEDTEEFINEVLLGKRCVPFYGEGWLDELRKHKLV